MEKIFADSEEKFLKAVVLYPDETAASARALYYDSELEKPVSRKDLVDLVIKRLVAIKTDDGYTFPVEIGYDEDETLGMGFVLVYAYLSGEDDFEAFTTTDSTLP